MARSPSTPLDLYNHPELWRWAGGMEGVPEWVDPAETFGEREGRAAWQARGNERFALLGALLPGLAIALALAVVGRAASESICPARSCGKRNSSGVRVPAATSCRTTSCTSMLCSPPRVGVTIRWPSSRIARYPLLQALRPYNSTLLSAA